jgi:Phosphotransferase enzyme family
MSLTQLGPAAGVATTALPLPGDAWGAADAVAALLEARDLLPLPLPAPVVVSSLTTVVLRCGDFAVKVYPPGTDPAHLTRLSVALAGSRSAHLPVCAPVVTEHGVVAVTPWVADVADAGPVSWAELGSLLRTFHEQHAGADLPRWSPLSRLASQVGSLPLPDEAAGVLLDARDALLTALGEVQSALGDGVVHGDVSPGNVLRGPGGPVLIDLDWVARAPREYDLSSASRRVADGEISPACYAAFCASYGHDVRSWPGLPVLDRIADLGGVAFRIWDDRRQGRTLDWMDAELPRWRTPL